MEKGQKIRLKLDWQPAAEALAEAMTAADILGRIRVLLEVSRKIQVNPMGPLAEKVFGEEQTAEAQRTPRGLLPTPDPRLPIPALFQEIIGWGEVVPRDAIGFLRALTPFTKRAWAKLHPQYRQAAFTISKVENVMVLERVRDVLAESLEKGWTKQETLTALNEAFDAAGMTRLNPYHLDTVYQTNMQTAYLNGRMKQMADPEVKRALPWWRYVTRGDELVRPNHAALDGFIARANDGVWSAVAPPNGFNCRCDLEPLLDSEARAILGPRAEISGEERRPAGGGPDAGFERTPAQFLRGLAQGEKFREEVISGQLSVTEN